MKGITFLDGLLRLKQLCVYMPQCSCTWKSCKRCMMYQWCGTVGRNLYRTIWIKDSIGPTWRKTWYIMFTCAWNVKTPRWCIKKFGLYRPLPILTSLLENVLMDFMTCVPLWQDKDVIFVVVENFSQLIKFVSTKKIGCKQDILYILVTLFSIWKQEKIKIKILLTFFWAFQNKWNL
jgi:hypothetical protein